MSFLRIFVAPRDSHSGMRGLCNYCLSCCVNTLLQTFSATWELLEILERWDAASVSSSSRNIPLQLRNVLKAMETDSLQPAPHKDFLHCLDKNSVRLNIQHDAGEVLLSILNLTQQQMNEKALALEIENLYKISLETYVQCLECCSLQTQTSYLLSLPLHVKEDNNSLEGCMTSYFEPQRLSGINCCFCLQCERKTTSSQGVKLCSLPPILCVHLKRFRNGRWGTRKLDCRVSFPETFDYSEVSKDAFTSDFSQDDCKYTLHAVVVHSGQAMCGHYTAFVRHRTNQHWYYANDTHVRKASWEDVQTTYGNGSSTAYILMYRRGSKEKRQQPELSG